MTIPMMGAVMTDRIDIRQAFESDKVFASAFPGGSWRPWIVALSLIYGLPLETEADRELAFQCSGRRSFPAGGFDESYFGVGRGSGKSRIALAAAVYQGLFANDWPSMLSPGERAKVLVIANDREQAAVSWSYANGLLRSSPFLAHFIESTTKTVISLRNGVDIEIATKDYRAVRGRTICCAVCEEMAFWRSELSANPAREVITALRPALMRLPGSKMFGISSVYAKEGLLYERIKRHWGDDGSDVLAWVAPSILMNPTLDVAAIEREIEADPIAARAEWMSIFRDDIESYIGDELLDRAIVPGRVTDLRASKRAGTPVAFADPSGGRGDSFALAIAQADKDGRVVVLALREIRPPFDPTEVVGEYAALLRSYGITEVVSDRYSAEWAAEAWRKAGIRQRDSEMTASDLFLNFLPLMTSGKVELPDHPRMRGQFRNLERRTRPGGKDTVSHPSGPGSHDDLANATAGASVYASKLSVGGVVFGVLGHSVQPEDVNPDDGRRAFASEFFRDLLKGGER